MREVYDHPHFIDEKGEVQEGEELAQFHTNSGRAEFVPVLIKRSWRRNENGMHLVTVVYIKQ